MPRKNVWTPEEHEAFVQAWEDVPARGGEGERKHCDRILERFAVLCGGETSRSAQALYVHQSVTTFNFKFIVEFDETHGVGSWFALSRRGREDVFLGSDHLSYPYLPMNQAMFERIKRIRERTAAIAGSSADARAATAAATASRLPSRRATRQTTTDTSSDIVARATEWSSDELALLVQAWRAEAKDAQLRSGEHTKFTANRSLRIYERFVALCGGRTTRTLAAVKTKRQDLTRSCEFILRFDAAQRASGKLTWYQLTKLQRLAVLGDSNKSGHFTDIPENLCARIVRLIGTDHSASARTSRDTSVASPRGTVHGDVNDNVRAKKPMLSKTMKTQPKRQAQQREQEQEDSGDDSNGVPRSSPAPKKLKRSASTSELSPGHVTDAYQELLDVAAGLEVQSHRVAELVRVLTPAATGSHDDRRATQRTGRLGERRSSLIRKEPARRRPTLPSSPGFGELVLQLQNQGAGEGTAWNS